MKTIEGGCPICHGDVRGDKENKFYCEHCNYLYSKVGDGRRARCVDREKGWLYFIDKQGDIARVKMARSRSDTGPKKHEKVKKIGVKKEKGFLYYVNKEGCIDRSPMQRNK
ncbi:MAG: hypothetical protein ABIB43_06630 [archaeon]